MGIKRYRPQFVRSNDDEFEEAPMFETAGADYVKASDILQELKALRDEWRCEYKRHHAPWRQKNHKVFERCADELDALIKGVE